MSSPRNSSAPIAPEGSSNPWSGGFTKWFSNITEWIKSLSPTGVASFDTGYVNATPNIVWRRYGKVVEIRVALDGTYPPGFTRLAQGAIPAEALPSGTNRRGAAWLGGSNNGHLYVASTSGDIYVLNPTSVNVSTAQGSITYLID